MTLMKVKLSFHGFKVFIFLCLLSGGARKLKKERERKREREEWVCGYVWEL